MVNKCEAIWHNAGMRLALLFFLLSLPARGDVEVRGRVFYPAAGLEKPAYTFSSQVSEAAGKSTAVSTYSDAAGKPLVTETAEFTAGRLTHYVYKQLQVSEAGEASVAGDTLRMSFTEEGETKTETEDLEPDTIVAPMIAPLLQRKWDALMKGDTIHVRYLAIERLETIGFKFFQDGERVLGGLPVVDVVMKPSSIFIAALVDPIHLSLTKEAPHWIVESEGRLPIRVPSRQPPQRRKDWKAIDARTEYDRPTTPPPPAPPPAPPAEAKPAVPPPAPPEASAPRPPAKKPAPSAPHKTR
jgi:hypothetical protein